MKTKQTTSVNSRIRRNFPNPNDHPFQTRQFNSQTSTPPAPRRPPQKRADDAPKRPPKRPYFIDAFSLNAFIPSVPPNRLARRVRPVRSPARPKFSQRLADSRHRIPSDRSREPPTTTPIPRPTHREPELDAGYYPPSPHPWLRTPSPSRRASTVQVNINIKRGRRSNTTARGTETRNPKSFRSIVRLDRHPPVRSRDGNRNEKILM